MPISALRLCYISFDFGSLLFLVIEYLGLQLLLNYNHSLQADSLTGMSELGVKTGE